MPYTLKLENNVLRFTLTGRVTAGDLMHAAAEARSYEENVPIVPHRITDLDGAELAIHYTDISALAGKRRELRFSNPFKSAIIARNAQQLGYARMFQTLNDNPQITIRIFPDESSASQWIADCSN
jgi:hypothetical protein